jgi:hypothetical protein
MIAIGCGGNGGGIYTGPKNEDPLGATSNERNTYAPGTVTRENRGKMTNGVRLFGFGDVNALGAEAVRGIEKTFAIADREYPGGQRKGLDFYGIALYEPHPACTSTPAFLVRGPAPASFNSDGSVSKGYDNDGVYDKDPRNGWYAVCAVGKFQQHTNLQTGESYYLLSLVNTGDVALWAQYEAEHAVLWDLDKVRFGETSGPGKESHPIFAQAGPPASELVK